jgi:beta-lactamase regulating signal transducer with metallopeptidase domain
MSDFIDLRLEPALWLMLDWSLRWGLLIVATGLWFAVRRPRQAALRLAACQLVLVAGLVMPLVPRWWGDKLLPNRCIGAVDDVAPEQLAAESAEPLPRASITKSRAIVEDRARPTVGSEPARADIATMEVSSSAAAQSAESLGAGRIVVLIAAALWSVGACVQLIRLIAASIWLSGLPCSERQPNPQSQELFDRCREGMGLRRPVRLGIHSALTAPVFVGGWRASVLVPSDWEQLGPDPQRAVLWHELTHVARRDDWAKLVEETIRAVFFFHPLVYWLLNRIEAYREQVCDAAAVRRGVAGRMLAEILVDFSRSALPGQRDAALRPALPFFRRRTVKSRIRELLEAATVARWSAPLVRGQFIGLAAIALSTGIALGCFGVSAGGSSPEPQGATNAEPKSPATSGKSPTTPKATAAPKTLERILANWKAREERTRSIYFSWESRWFVGQAADDRNEGKASLQQAERSSQFTLWAERPYRFRLDRAPLAASAPTSFVGKTRSVTSGLTELNVQEPGNTAGLPVATVSARSDQSPLATANPGLTFAFHPEDALVNSRSRSFRVVSEDALVNGLHCVEIQKSNERGNVIEKCWVDPARDDVVVAYEHWFPPQQRRSTMSIEYQQDRVHGWVPARWTDSSAGERREETVTNYAINEPIPAETFSLKLAPGTLVFDQRAREQYRVAKDGSKSDVVNAVSLPSLRILEALASKSDFKIEPQALNDAVHFIAARYQIPIVLKQKEFAEAGIDLASEVQVPREGMVVADVLKSVLGQAQKPAGFRIEDEVLKISPKFLGQEPIHVRPAPVAPKLESPKARKIREALEMQVDFTIEPQSLKDALDWIAARYQIKIVIDKTVASKTDVHFAAPGIRLRSLLSNLLEQCRKPVGFKIEDDALKIYPEVATP